MARVFRSEHLASVVDAVRWAVEVHRWMIDGEPEVVDEGRTFRIGINLGDVIAEEHDILPGCCSTNLIRQLADAFFRQTICVSLPSGSD